MSMERVFELLSAAADDDLSATERAELDALLEESADARRLKSELQQMEKLMENVSQVDPPDGLDEQILRRATLPEPAKAWSIADWLHPIRSGAAWRYGFSAAFGALLVIAVYESQPRLGPAADITELVGTMAPDSGGARTILDTFSFERTGIASIARLERRDNALVLDVRIDTMRPVEIVMDFAAAGLEFEALAQTQTWLESIQFANNVLRVKGRGQRRFSVLLQMSDDISFPGETKIGLEYSSDGTLLEQGSLSSSRLDERASPNR